MRNKMKVLFVSGELIAGDVVCRLKQEGCDVKLFIKDESRKDCFENMVEKTNDWKKELDWVGKEGLIIFDDVGYGKVQDELRGNGYTVFGGSKESDRLEKERSFAQDIFSKNGIGKIPTLNFKDTEEAIDFVKKNRAEWVVKQQGHLSMLNYVGQMSDGLDVLSILKNYKKNKKSVGAVSLQKKVKGVEIGVARYFNGNDWVGPIEINIEHKSLFPGGIGPMTGEMGTLMWYDDDENNKLFQATIAKLEGHLRNINFKGDFDINFIINKDKVYPLEATCRLGCPSTQLQTSLHLSPWSEFLTAIAKGKPYELKYKKGYGIVVSISIPPFPYKGISKNFYISGANILFKEELTDDEKNNLHFEEVSKNSKGVYTVAGSNGYIVYVTGTGKTIEEARRKAYALVDKIVIPRMFYRQDIGLDFLNRDQKLLKKWGWIK